jgi:hypothetical protein
MYEVSICIQNGCLHHVRTTNHTSIWLFAPRTKYESHISLVVCTAYVLRITHQFGCLHGVQNTNRTSIWLFARRTNYESRLMMVGWTTYEIRITPHITLLLNLTPSLLATLFSERFLLSLQFRKKTTDGSAMNIPIYRNYRQRITEKSGKFYH